MLRAPLLLLCLALLLIVSGCGDSSPYKTVEVSGIVTYEGRPVGNIGLIFTPQEGRPSLAITDDSGSFALYYTQEKSGAQVGTHQVVFEFPPTPLDGSLPEKTEPTDDIKAILDAHGARGTPLSVEITKPTADLKIELP